MSTSAARNNSVPPDFVQYAGSGLLSDIISADVLERELKSWTAWREKDASFNLAIATANRLALALKNIEVYRKRHVPTLRVAAIIWPLLKVEIACTAERNRTNPGLIELVRHFRDLHNKYNGYTEDFMLEAVQVPVPGGLENEQFMSVRRVGPVHWWMVLSRVHLNPARMGIIRAHIVTVWNSILQQKAKNAAAANAVQQSGSSQASPDARVLPLSSALQSRESLHHVSSSGAEGPAEVSQARGGPGGSSAPPPGLPTAPGPPEPRPAQHALPTVQAHTASTSSAGQRVGSMGPPPPPSTAPKAAPESTKETKGKKAFFDPPHGVNTGKIRVVVDDAEVLARAGPDGKLKPEDVWSLKGMYGLREVILKEGVCFKCQLMRLPCIYRGFNACTICWVTSKQCSGAGVPELPQGKKPEDYQGKPEVRAETVRFLLEGGYVSQADIDKWMTENYATRSLETEPSAPQAPIARSQSQAAPLAQAASLPARQAQTDVESDVSLSSLAQPPLQAVPSIGSKRARSSSNFSGPAKQHDSPPRKKAHEHQSQVARVSSPPITGYIPLPIASRPRNVEGLNALIDHQIAVIVYERGQNEQLRIENAVLRQQLEQAASYQDATLRNNDILQHLEEIKEAITPSASSQQSRVYTTPAHLKPGYAPPAQASAHTAPVTASAPPTASSTARSAPQASRAPTSEALKRAMAFGQAVGPPKPAGPGSSAGPAAPRTISVGPEVSASSESSPTSSQAHILAYKDTADTQLGLPMEDDEMRIFHRVFNAVDDEELPLPDDLLPGQEDQDELEDADTWGVPAESTAAADKEVEEPEEVTGLVRADETDSEESDARGNTGASGAGQADASSAEDAEEPESEPKVRRSTRGAKPTRAYVEPKRQPSGRKSGASSSASPAKQSSNPEPRAPAAGKKPPRRW
ncbi:unnamed protein product [Peniophora sp. CBMAI 1063]|nr:unnamed protein product [Peniophora sp. CBMAI 1063]